MVKKNADALKVMLDVEDVPKKWYNIQADLPNKAPPPLHPGTKQPMTPDDLKVLFPMELIRQEATQEKWIDIPAEVRDALIHLGRPTPLYRAKRLEKFLKTPAKIFYKREDVSFTGSHKSNTAIAQAYYNKKEGIENITTETGAGQWGSALSLACAMFDLKCLVYMVKISYEQKPYRKYIMKMYGADVIPSPSNTTKAGRDILAKDPDCPGSLGMAISEAIEVALADEKTHYSLGSVLNHVLLHQTVIGLETQQQLKAFDVTPDVMIGCVGGGSNFAGFAFPFIGEKIHKKLDAKFVAVEPVSVPSLTGRNTGQSKYEYDFGDTAGMTPLIKMYTLGHKFIPQSIHAGGLRYHGMAPLVSQLYHENLIEAEAYAQEDTFEAGQIFAKTEGIIPAPETNHALASVIAYAREAKEKNEPKNIVMNFSGHGLIDMQSYASILKMG